MCYSQKYIFELDSTNYHLILKHIASPDACTPEKVDWILDDLWKFRYWYKLLSIHVSTTSYPWAQFLIGEV